MKPTHHVTQLQTLLQCPRLYYERYVIGEDMEESVPLIVGSIFHVSRQGDAGVQLAEKMLDAAHIPLKELHEAKMLIKAPPHQIETELNGPIYEHAAYYQKDAEYNLRGRIDLVGYRQEEGRDILTIIDYKTARQEYHETDVWEHNHQWYLYPAMMGMELKLPKDELITSGYLVYKKNPSNHVEPQCLLQTLPFSEYLDRFTKSWVHYKMTIALDDFPSDPDHGSRCFSCPYKRQCFG